MLLHHTNWVSLLVGGGALSLRGRHQGLLCRDLAASVVHVWPGRYGLIGAAVQNIAFRATLATLLRGATNTTESKLRLAK